MQLHHLKHRHKKSQRVGRGGKRGTTAGRGTKGQRSRSGHRIRPASRDLLIRIPKLRGFRNKGRTERAIIVDLTTLSRKLKSLAGKEALTVDKITLKKLGLVPAGYHGKVKILSDGDIQFPISVRGLDISHAAQEKIVQAGGNVSN